MVTARIAFGNGSTLLIRNGEGVGSKTNPVAHVEVLHPGKNPHRLGVIGVDQLEKATKAIRAGA